MAITPMFPLGTVLLPGTALPLRIFEPRYQQLFADCLAGDSEFGVVLIERGAEVGGGDERFGVGTLAHIEDHRALGGGQQALIALGRQRIRVRHWHDDDPYPRAEISPWPDAIGADTDGLADSYATCGSRLRRLLAIAAESGHPVAPATFDAPEDPVVGSYLLSALAPLGALDRQHLLETAGPSERLALLDHLITDVEVLLGVEPPADG